MSTAPHIVARAEGVAFKPLLRFFLRSRMTRSQIVVTFIYVVTMVFLTFFSRKYSVDIELRLAWYAFFMPFFWPAWLVDDELSPRGAMRLFVVPRSPIRPVMLAYLAARNIYALGVGAFSILMVYNIQIGDITGEIGGEMFRSLTIFTFSACFVIVNAAAFLGMFMRGRLMLVVLYTFTIVLAKIQARWEDPIRSSIGMIIGPMWSFSYTWVEVVVESPWLIVQVLTASVFWAAMAWLVFQRKFR